MNYEDPDVMGASKLAVLARMMCSLSCRTSSSRFPLEDLQCHGALFQGVNPFWSYTEHYCSLVALAKYCSWSKNISLAYFIKSTRVSRHQNTRSTFGCSAFLKGYICGQDGQVAAVNASKCATYQWKMEFSNSSHLPVNFPPFTLWSGLFSQI